MTVRKLLTLSPVTTSGMQLSGFSFLIPGSAASRFTTCQRELWKVPESVGAFDER